MKMKAQWELPSGSKGVKCIAWDRSSSKVACIDMSNDHWVRVYGIGKTSPIFE